MKILRVVVYLIIIFLFQEAVLRFLFPLPEVKNFNRINYIQLPSTEQGKPVRNMLLSSVSLPDTNAEFIETLNNYGFRDKNWKLEKQPGKKRILMIGDSFVEGFLADEDETITASFQREAEKSEMEIDLMNMGIASGNINTYAKLVVDVIPLFKPDEIIILMYANDNYYFSPFSVIAPLIPERNNQLMPRLLALIEMLRRGEMLPHRFPFKKSYFITTELINAQLAGNPDSESILRKLPSQITQAIRKGNFDPANIDIIFRKEERFRHPVSISNEMAFLKNYCDKSDVRLMVAYLPSRSQATDYYYKFQKATCSSCPETLSLTGETYRQLANAVSQSCASLKIPFFDLTPLVSEEEKKGNHLYWNYDVHMRGNGYKWTGKALFNWYQRGGESKEE